MRIFILIFILLPTVAMAEQRINYDCKIIVEHGDSFIKLFGNDWLKVVQANKKFVFYNNKGKTMPDKLVAGTVLNIPAETYLTEIAIKRLNTYEQIKSKAMQVISAGKNYLQNKRGIETDTFIEGKEFLNKAVNYFYKERNYIAAEKLANKAILYFKIDLIKNYFVNFTKNTSLFFMFFTVLLSLTAAHGVFIIEKYKQKKSWLKNHKFCLNKLLIENQSII